VPRHRGPWLRQGQLQVRSGGRREEGGGKGPNRAGRREGHTARARKSELAAPSFHHPGTLPGRLPPPPSPRPRTYLDAEAVRREVRPLIENKARIVVAPVGALKGGLVVVG
jgi:hypothetical protein